MTSRPLRFAIVSALVAVLLGACSGKTSSSGGNGGGADGSPGCVNVDPSTYDRSCQQDSDCVTITPGEVCPGECGCGGATVNASEKARYAAAVAGLLTGVCNCPAEGVPRCVQSACVLCLPGAGQPGCPDGG